MPDGQETPTSIAIDTTAGQIVRLETKRRLLKQRYDQMKTSYETAKTELDLLKSRKSDPTVEQLQAELAEIKHRKLFDRLASEAKARPEALDDIWRLSGYQIDPRADVINETALKALIVDQQKTRPYLFAAKEEPVVETPKPEENLPPGPGNSRGNLARDTGKFQVTRSQLRNMTPQLQARLHEEYQKDNVEIIDG